MTSSCSIWLIDRSAKNGTRAHSHLGLDVLPCRGFAAAVLGVRDVPGADLSDREPLADGGADLGLPDQTAQASPRPAGGSAPSGRRGRALVPIRRL